MVLEWWGSRPIAIPNPSENVLSDTTKKPLCARTFSGRKPHNFNDMVNVCKYSIHGAYGIRNAWKCMEILPIDSQLLSSLNIPSFWDYTCEWNKWWPPVVGGSLSLGFVSLQLYHPCCESTYLAIASIIHRPQMVLLPLQIGHALSLNLLNLSTDLNPLDISHHQCIC